MADQVDDVVRKVLEWYAGGRPLAELARAFPEPRPATVAAIIRLKEAANASRAAIDEAVRQAAAATEQEPDATLSFVLLNTWLRTCGRVQRYDEARAILRRAGQLLTPDSPRELQAEFKVSAGLVKAWEGDKEARERSFDEALALLPGDSPLRRETVWNRAIHFSQEGRGGECEADLAWLAGRTDERFGVPQIALPRFLNFLATGRADEAEDALRLVEGDPALVGRMARLIARGRALIALMRGRWREAGIALAHIHWAASTQCLLDRRLDEALVHARAAAEEHDWFLADVMFPVYTLVRAELACRNGEAARRLIDKRCSAGTRLYLDSFFLARVELLAERREAAAAHFAEAVRACDLHQAQKRLDFELLLAAELSPGDLVALTRTAAAMPAAPAESAPVPPLPPVPAEPASSADMRGAARLIGRSPAMAELRANIKRMAPLDASLLIAGETGTGKELVAMALHEESPRASEPFLAINCGAIAETLLESELFGHERGAFTGAHRAHRGVFEEAGRGTVLLDEIGDISPRLQVALLRVLESAEVRPVGSSSNRHVECRVLAATNADLERLAAAGGFRKDLIFRLKRLEIRVPALRDRREDILELAGHFLGEGRRDGIRPVMSDDLRRALLAHAWPGNVRELRNEVERIRLLGSEKRTYTLEDLAGRLRSAPARADRKSVG